MTRTQRTAKDVSSGSGDELAEPRQIRFQKNVDKAICDMATTEGTDFPTITRMLVRRALRSKVTLGGKQP